MQEPLPEKPKKKPGRPSKAEIKARLDPAREAIKDIGMSNRKEDVDSLMPLAKPTEKSHLLRFLDEATGKFGLTYQQEIFCRWYVKTGSLPKSLQEAGFLRDAVHDNKGKLQYAINKETKKLLDDEKVVKRISDLVKSEINRLDLTEESIAEKWLRIYDRSFEIDDLTNANKALEHLGKYKNMFVEKSLNVHKHILEPSSDVKELDEQIEKIFRVATAGTRPPMIDVKPTVIEPIPLEPASLELPFEEIKKE